MNGCCLQQEGVCQYGLYAGVLLQTSYKRVSIRADGDKLSFGQATVSAGKGDPQTSALVQSAGLYKYSSEPRVGVGDQLSAPTLPFTLGAGQAHSLRSA